MVIICRVCCYNHASQWKDVQVWVHMSELEGAEAWAPARRERRGLPRRGVLWRWEPGLLVCMYRAFPRVCGEDISSQLPAGFPLHLLE